MNGEGNFDSCLSLENVSIRVRRYLIPWCGRKLLETLTQLSFESIAGLKQSYANRYRRELEKDLLSYYCPNIPSLRQYRKINFGLIQQYPNYSELGEVLLAIKPWKKYSSPFVFQSLIMRLGPEQLALTRSLLLEQLGERVLLSLDCRIEELCKLEFGDELLQSRWRCLLDGDLVGERMFALRKAFLDRDPSELILILSRLTNRKSVVDRYNMEFGEISEDIRTFSGLFFDVLNNLVLEGAVPPAILVRSCLEGFGTDLEGLRILMDGLSRAEIEQLSDDYSKRFKTILGQSRSLESDLWWDLSNRDWQDAKLWLKGSPTNINEMYERILERFEYERHGYLSLLLNVSSIFRDEKHNMIRSMNDIESFMDSYDEIGSLGDEAIRQFQFLTRKAELSLDAFRVTVRDGAEILSDLISGGVATLVALYFSLKLPFLLLGSLVGASSMLARTIAKSLVKGFYSLEEILWDAVRACFDGALLYLNRILRWGFFTQGILARSAIKSTMRSGFKTAVMATRKLEERAAARVSSRKEGSKPSSQ